MLNFKCDRVKQLKTYIMKSFKESGKKHLLITGCKECGKTTVLKEILKDQKSYGGIITNAERDDKIPPKYVLLRDINNPNNSGKIACRNESCTGLIPVIETFDILGRDILSNYLNSNIYLIVIDEIGFLENKALEYQNEIIKCFDEKSVIAVIRKEINTFTERLINRNDVFLVDVEYLRNYCLNQNI